MLILASIGRVCIRYWRIGWLLGRIEVFVGHSAGLISRVRIWLRLLVLILLVGRRWPASIID